MNSCSNPPFTTPNETLMAPDSSVSNFPHLTEV
ncbi:Uncharacterised protein [Vibrio cholerae]|nr:Uncharacterised protein [Vibrio cholerae]